ncbi:YqaH family protein [Bacillus altitudinis]|uniref:YqaH family protein n=1 Tax=Bacillus TaxID=1386 RepID=UPI0021073EC3|nr:YqaH family protein [Bacillus sp. FS02]
MDLNQFLKADCEKSVRLIKSTQFLVDELLSDAIKDQDFDGCVEIAGSVITNCKELKRIKQSEHRVQLHKIASKFEDRGLKISNVTRPMK